MISIVTSRHSTVLFNYDVSTTGRDSLSVRMATVNAEEKVEPQPCFSRASLFRRRCSSSHERLRWRAKNQIFSF